jgi:hypothetical protein
MPVKLPKAETAVLDYLFDHAPVAPEAEAFEFRSTVDGATQLAAAVALSDDPSLHLVSTLGSRGLHVFLTVTDGAPDAVAAALADLETYDARTTRLGHGETVPLEHDALRKAGRTAALLLRPAVSNALPEFPDTAVVGRRSLHFFLVVFLDDAEHALKKAHGLDALLDRFDSAGRDLVQLELPAAR